MKRFYTFFPKLILFCLVSSITGCEIINPEEDTPAYLQINNITLDPNSYENGKVKNNYGSASAQIADVWLYANGKNLGVYELPATIPILEHGDVRIDIKPGIIIDGLKGNRIQLEFYRQTSTVVSLKPGAVTTLDTSITFVAGMKSLLNVNEQFNTLNNQFGLRLRNQSTAFSLKNPAVNPDDSLNFKFASGRIGLVEETANAVFSEPVILESLFSGQLRHNSKVVLELDYRSTMDFGAGLSVKPITGGLGVEDIEIFVRKSREWNHIYIDLTNQVNKSNFIGADFQVILKATPTSNPKDYIAVDNVRLLHY